MTTATSASTFDQTLTSLGITNPSTVNQPAVASSTSSATTLNQADFLTLMTAQLKNQDPFNPVDDNQMVAQMAQLSTVSGISQMNSTLSGIASKLNATSTADAMSYVGKTVLTPGSTAYARASGGIAGKVELGGDATDVTVTIADANGNTLKTLSLGAESKGTVDYDWDGTTSTGATATGPFTVSVAATSGGASVSATNLVWAPVESVTLNQGSDPTLNVTGVGAVKPADIRQVG